jgi:hypothetical protein
MTVTRQNCINEEIKSRLNSGNGCYNSLHNHLLSSLLFKNVIILPSAFYGCATLSLTEREEYKLRVFDKTLLRKIFGSESEEVIRDWRKVYSD